MIGWLYYRLGDYVQIEPLSTIGRFFVSTALEQCVRCRSVLRWTIYNDYIPSHR